MARTLLGKLKRGLFMTHTEFLEKAGETFRREGPVAPANLDRLEEALIASDAGVELSLRLVDALREEVGAGRITTAEELRPAVREQLLSLLREAEDAQPVADVSEKPRVTLLVGVNGTGKTTTAAKLAKRKKEAGSTVILAAADTFRAAAVDQLKIWAERVGAPVDPSAGGRRSGSRRLRRHRLGPLKEHRRGPRGHGRPPSHPSQSDEGTGEGEKGRGTRSSRCTARGACWSSTPPPAPTASSKHRQFGAIAGVTGVVLTKLDGTAKGGVILAIADSLKLPVRWVGVGEDVDDLLPFEAEDFVDSSARNRIGRCSRRFCVTGRTG